MIFLSLLPPTIEKWTVILVVLLVIIALFKEIIRPALAFFVGVLSLVLLGIISAQDYLSSFSNQQIATIILLIFITSALRKTYDLESFLDKLFSKATTGKGLLWRMGLLTASLSSILNNTPVVAVMTPYIYGWGRKREIAPSKLLIPLSYSTILGGMITLIGTSTNLVLNGFLSEHDLPQLQFSDFFFLGILVTLFGIGYLYFFGYDLLPENRDTFNDLNALPKADYIIETQIDGMSRLIGGTVQEAGLLDLDGAYLIEIHRGERVIAPIRPDEFVMPDDVLMFMGKSETIAALVKSGVGLKIPKHEDHFELIEAVIPGNSAFSGEQINSLDFREDYGAEVISIHRNGKKLSGDLKEIRLLHGDLLLLSVNQSFLAHLSSDKDLYILSKIEKEVFYDANKLKIFLGSLILIIPSVILGAISLFVGVMSIFAMILLLKFFTFKDINKELDIDLIIVLVCALTLGNALIKTGAASLVATNFIAVFGFFGHTGLLIGIFIITVLLTSFITNIAAVSIVFPITFSLTQSLGIDGTAFYVAIVFAASAAFMTPISYQTNWMVYGPGGYKASDFFKIGFPLTVIYTIVCLGFIILRYEVA